jgi:predicted ATP-dependent endonuclease of OLD family
MAIKSITIRNYKSIQELTIPLQRYGESYTAFLIGLNESGKSNILEAIQFIDNTKELDFDSCFHKGAESDKNKEISVSVEIDINSTNGWKQEMRKAIRIDQSILEKVEITRIEKVISFSKKKKMKEVNRESWYNIEISGDESLFSQYENIALPNCCTQNENCAIIALDNQAILTKESFKEKIISSLSEYFDSIIPYVQIWSSFISRVNQLETISRVNQLETFDFVNKFSDFYLGRLLEIAGKSINYSGRDLDEVRKKLLSDETYRNNFQEEMSKSITDFINDIWKQNQKINVCVQVVDTTIHIDIEEEDNKGVLYNTTQRSDGFKQMMSMMSSLSLQNKNKKLRNTVILIDEPEIHLHPSAIQDMREELVRIGKNCPVIVATHSNYMIDANCPERHFLVTKNTGKTSVQRLENNSDFYDDKVSYPAFGLNFFKELLPENIILVEGNSDRIILNHAIRKLNGNLSFSIKATNGTGTSPKFAKFLSDENVKPFIIFDEDAKDRKKNILEQQKDYYNANNVFTLKDLVPKLPDDATIEDVLPFEFVKKFFKDKLNITLENNNKAIMQQLKKLHQTKEEKQKITDLKVPLANTFCKSFSTRDQIGNDAPKLSELVNSLGIKLNKIKKI